MVVLLIFMLLIAIAVYAAVGYLCGRICADIIRFKNKNQSEVLWFWLGFVFTWLAILLTVVVKEDIE